MTATKTLTTADLAEKLNTDPRTLRKFLRASMPKDAQPGKGSRYALPATAKDINAMRKAFLKWGEAVVAAKQAAADAKAASTEVTDEDEIELAEANAMTPAEIDELMNELDEDEN